MEPFTTEQTPQISNTISAENGSTKGTCVEATTDGSEQHGLLGVYSLKQVHDQLCPISNQIWFGRMLTHRCRRVRIKMWDICAAGKHSFWRCDLGSVCLPCISGMFAGHSYRWRFRSLLLLSPLSCVVTSIEGY